MKSVEVEERIERESVEVPSVEKGGTTRGSESEPKGAQRFHPLLELTLARVREFLRKPEVIFWVFVFPLLLVFALGIAFRNTGPQKIRIAVEKSETNASASSTIADALSNSKDIEAVQLTPAEATQELRSGKVALVVHPNDVQNVGTQGSSDATTSEANSAAPSFSYRYDPTRADSRQARMVVDDALERAAGRKDVASASDEAFTEPGGRYIDFLIPGLLGMNLMGSGLWGIGFAVVNARTKKLLKRFAATPMRRSHYLLSFILSRLVFLFLEVAALVGFGWWVFHVGVRGSFGAVALITVLGALSFAGLGMLVASRARTIEAVSGLMNLVMLPMWILSGTFFSYARFPDAMPPLVKALPLTALNDALRAVMIDGTGVSRLGAPLAIVAGWGAVSFLVALQISRWR